MIKYPKIFATLLLVAFLLVTASCAEEKGSTKPKKSPWDEITKDEICERIKHMLEISPEAADFIPKLKIATDKEGNITEIKYNIDGIFKDIKELDKETLIKIHNRINIERTRIQTERIQRQMEAIRASQNVQRPPRVYTPPAVPKPHTPPPQPPKVPSPPPTPPAPQRR
ncbi:MAG: hypothetical protein WBC74_02550 [Candidatus Omnitrophota bacterium]